MDYFMAEYLEYGVKNNFLSRLVYGMNVVGCFWTGALMLLVLIDVGGRFFFNCPLTGAPEIIQASIVGITFLQIPYVQLINQHLVVTVFYDKMGPKMKKVIDAIGAVMGTAVFGLITYSGLNCLAEAIRIGEYDGTSASIMLPTWPVRSLIILGSLTMVALCIWNLITLLRRKERSGL